MHKKEFLDYKVDSLTVQIHITFVKVFQAAYKPDLWRLGKLTWWN